MPRSRNGENSLGKIVEGTDNLYIIKFEDTAEDQLKTKCYTSLVCEERPGKNYLNCT